MSSVEKAVAQGHYARKQLFCRDAIVAWSHQSRFKTARRLVEPYAGGRLLDYGSGDGTFLAMVHDLFPRMVGADDPGQAGDCRKRFAGLTGLSFEALADVKDRAYDGAFDVVTCMEVLEHCVESAEEAVLSDLRRLAAPAATVIVSVPVEIGPTLIGKQVVRAVAGWRGLGDYKYRETYRPGEFWRMVLAGRHTAITRPLYPSPHPGNGRPHHSHGHKGFNWRALRARISGRFQVRETRFSPLPWLGGYLSSQVWFICKPK